ncbi:hypothetical protein DES34_109123 [Brevibacillus brevis]|nr:hypothetical protein C7J99_28100 [Brevibacillus brevis]RED27830.1 hypothetical protein DES34_109123 [Brevibacillus brevis]VEF86868.1 Uncharacterised protein [Brevibacillus brevis]
MSSVFLCVKIFQLQFLIEQRRLNIILFDIKFRHDIISLNGKRLQFILDMGNSLRFFPNQLLCISTSFPPLIESVASLATLIQKNHFMIKYNVLHWFDYT